MPGGSRVVLELQGTPTATVPYGVADGAVEMTLDVLRRAISSSFEIMKLMETNFSDNFPGRTGKMEFGIAITGELDAKIVSASASPTFAVTLEIG